MTCTHLDAIAVDLETAPDATGGCEDCRREGSTWVHLRQCLTCGHVRCCDSSPRRHATAHAQAASHPLVRSAEPDEAWLWCYADRTALELRA